MWHVHEKSDDDLYFFPLKEKQQKNYLPCEKQGHACSSFSQIKQLQKKGNLLHNALNNLFQS